MKRNNTMVMDLYELTMSYSYFKTENINEKVAFDVFFRRIPDKGGYAVFAGLEQIIEYIKDVHFDKDDIDYLREQNIFDEEFLNYLSNFKFTGDLYAFKEGSIIYPNEPIITIVAPIIEAQIIETALLVIFNHQSLIATKSSRMNLSAEGRNISDFGARRAHNMDAAIYGARAAYIGGVSSTATVLAGKMFNIPVNGTMAHSYVMYYESEYEAFKHYALTYPDNTCLLVDTYDTLNSGVLNAIKVSKEVLEPKGYRLKSIRIDSGDLAYLSKKARKMLDDANLTDCKIVVSNSLDEKTIASLIDQGACIDFFGVGERLITASSEPVFGGVYKLAATFKNGEYKPKIKISDNEEKITNPGLKKVYRVYNESGNAIADLIAKHDEVITDYEELSYVDPSAPWKKRSFKGCVFKELQQIIFKDGKLVYENPDINTIREFVKYQLSNEIWIEEQRLEYPHIHYLDMTEDYYKMKMDMIYENK